MPLCRCINSLWATMSVCAKHVVLRWKPSFSNSKRCCRQQCRGAALLPLCRCRISLLSRHPAIGHQSRAAMGQSACAVGGTWLGEGELGVCGALGHRASRPDLLLPLALAVPLCFLKLVPQSNFVQQSHDTPTFLGCLGVTEPTGQSSGGLESADLKYHARPPPGLPWHRWVVSSPVERGL